MYIMVVVKGYSHENSHARYLAGYPVSGEIYLLLNCLSCLPLLIVTAARRSNP